MSTSASIRTAAAQRRQKRDAQRRLRESQRQAKQAAKLSEAEQARFEVESFEKQLDLLLSIHKEQGESWDWLAVHSSLAPHRPEKRATRKFKAENALLLSNLQPNAQTNVQHELAAARIGDEQDFENALLQFAKERDYNQRLRELAPRILAGEPKAYTEALSDLNPFIDLSDLGSALNFVVHDCQTVECRLKVQGRKIIPEQVKSLTAAGKVSVKAMPKARFHELYQDYVCSCVFRVAREVMALLPIQHVLITASVDAIDTRTGGNIEQPVLSVIVSRDALARIDCNNIDPSDAIETFPHAGDFKASRKTGEFAPIVPLTSADVPGKLSEASDWDELTATIQRIRAEIKGELRSLNNRTAS